MRTIIMICTFNTPDYSLISLQREHAKWVLIVIRDAYELMDETSKNYYDEIIALDTITPESVTDAIRSIAEHTNTSEIVLLPTKEDGLMLAAQAREELDLPGDRTSYVKRFTDKSEMKKMLADSDVNLPRYSTYSASDHPSDDEALVAIEKQIGDYPMFYKPYDGYGAIDVGVLHDESELRSWLQSTNDRCYLIEEFLQGTMYHFDSLINQGEIILQCGAEYAWPCDQFHLGHPIGSIILPFDSDIYQRLKALNEDIISIMSPNNCATHMECFRLSDDRLVFVEIAARAPGGRIVDLYQRQWEINLALMHLQSQLGILPTIELTHSDKYYAWAFIPILHGEVERLDLPHFSSRINMEWFIKPGDQFPGAFFNRSELSFSKKYIAGTIVISNESYDDLAADFNTIRHHAFVKYKEIK